MVKTEYRQTRKGAVRVSSSDPRAGIMAAVVALVVITTMWCLTIWIARAGALEEADKWRRLALHSQVEAKNAQDLADAAIEEAEFWRAEYSKADASAKAASKRAAEASAAAAAVRRELESERRKRTSAPSSKSSSGWSSAKVSWYGPGFYGNTMAGGGKLTKSSMVVAHKSLPFGTTVQFRYKGRTVTAVVQDRGPYVAGRAFDLGPGTAKALGFSGVGTVEYRIVGSRTSWTGDFPPSKTRARYRQELWQRRWLSWTA